MKSHRVIFIDLARALAVIAMIYGHTIDAVLAPEYRAGRWFAAWQFQRGLTSCLFLLLSGFAFSLATTRHWALHVHLSAQMLRRARRFALFVVLGYALHFPVARFAELPGAGADQWRSFLHVDVLQLIGVMFLLVQGLVLMTRTRRAFGIASASLAVTVALMTPLAWATNWERLLPVGLAAYFSPTGGSQFPLFPWAAYVLAGAALGQVYARWGGTHRRTYTNLVLLLPGVMLVAVGLTVSEVPPWLFASAPWNWVPPQVALRAGACLVVLGAVSHASEWLTRLPHAFAAVAQETLLIYFVHLCIVYGSPWSPGLAQYLGRTLDPRATALTVLALLVSMTALAAYWNWQKHVRPGVARRMTVAAWAALAVPLL